MMHRRFQREPSPPLAAKAAPPVKTDMPKGAGAPDSRPSGWGRHGVADASIGLEIAPVLFGTRRCEPIFNAGPKMLSRLQVGMLLGFEQVPLSI
jgi:hypothetical protein